MEFINLTLENIDKEHLCCAISDKKHGVDNKKLWLKDRFSEGHVFRKLDVNGKVFIEYAPLEYAWTPIEGENYLYIYCLWVSGKYKGQGYGKDLLNYCIDDAKRQCKSGICILSSKKKKSFLSEKKFLLKFGFKNIESIGEYELLALSFDGTMPKFCDNVKIGKIESKKPTIFYSSQCPFTVGCIEQIQRRSESENYEIDLILVNSLEQAKKLPCIFNNWALFDQGNFITVQLLDAKLLIKELNKNKIEGKVCLN